MSDLVVFIITHGRADSVVTDVTLRSHGYTGPIYYVIDDEDAQGDAYRAKYGEAVLEFDKKSYADQTDEGDNFDNRRTTTHARNACFDLAERIGVEWFLVLDDDYSSFDFRTTGRGQYPRCNFKIRTQLDEVFREVLTFFQGIEAGTVALAQGGDFLGGHECSSSWVTHGRPMRKVMNTFFCSTSRRLQFIGRLNEDVNMYLAQGFKGSVCLTIPLVSITQKATQSSKGGMSDAYLESGTYVKSFYSVMYAPHSVKVSMVGNMHRRLHHQINWKTAVPKIVSQDMRKAGSDRMA